MKIPVRQCAACRGRFEKRELLRIVRTPDGRIVPDEKGKTPGRGVYICRKEECLNKALKQNALSRALEAPVPPDTEETLRRIITEGNDG